MLRRIVNSQALRLVPGWNFSELLHARRSDSWTRSSASETEPDREIANARKFLISASNSSLKLVEGIGPPRRGGNLLSLETSKQFHELVRKRRVDQAGIMLLERASYCFHALWVGRSGVQNLNLLPPGRVHAKCPAANVPHS